MQPVEVPYFGGRGGHDQVAVLGQPGHRQIRFDAAPLVQPLGIDDAAGTHVNVVRTDVVQHPGGIRALEPELGERGQVEQPHLLAHRPVFRRGMLKPVLPSITVLVAGQARVRRVPVGPLPARDLAVAGADGLQAIVERRFANAAGGVVLTIGVVGGVQQAEALRDPFAQVLAVALERLIAAHIHFPQVRRRMAEANPLRDHLADPAGGLQTDGIQPRRHEAVVEFGRLAEVVAHVRRKTLRAAEERLKPGEFECRYAHHGLLEDGLEMLETAGDLIETEILGDARRGPRAGMGFEGAEEQLAGVVLVVGAGVVVADDREGRIQPRHRFEQGVVVLACMQGHVHPDRRRQLPRPHAGAQHNAVRIDIASIGGHAGHAAGPGADGRDRHVLKDARAGRAGALGQRVGDVYRVGITVGRNVDAAEQIPGMQQGYPLLDGRGRDHLHVQPEYLRHRRAALQLLEPLLIGGNGEGPAAPVAGRLAGFRLQAPVERARVARQLGHVDGRAQLPDQSRRVPGGARGELPAFQQRHVGDPVSRQVIGDRAADHAAADHDHAGTARQGGGVVGTSRHEPSGA